MTAKDTTKDNTLGVHNEPMSYGELPECECCKRQFINLESSELCKNCQAYIEAQVSKRLLEIIGEDEAHIVIDTGVATDQCDAYKSGKEADCNCPAGERNNFRHELRQSIEGKE